MGRGRVCVGGLVLPGLKIDEIDEIDERDEID